MRLFFWNVLYKGSWRITHWSTKVADYASKRHIEIALEDVDE